MAEASEVTLYTSGHLGTEAEFGIQAEKWGVQEVTYSFEGHKPKRENGLKVLTPEELDHGNVSFDIIDKHMERVYRHTMTMRKVFQTLFHVINQGYQVFGVGWLLSNGTLKGGTGWGIELAKFFNRPLHVFDLESKEWLSWQNKQWVLEDPVILHKTISATGTRFPTEEAKAAIVGLFERSFGPKA
ncbi:MAG: hypothetical protein ACOCW2_01255 [Chitinivibrionales bacterium]